MACVWFGAAGGPLAFLAGERLGGLLAEQVNWAAAMTLCTRVAAVGDAVTR